MLFYPSFLSSSLWNIRKRYTLINKLEIYPLTSPSSQETKVPLDRELIIDFRENVVKNTNVDGKITIYDSSDIIFETISVNSSQVSQGETLNKIIIRPTKSFLKNTIYYVLLDQDSFLTENGVSTYGITDKKDFTFKTLDTEPPLMNISSSTFSSGDVIEQSFLTVLFQPTEDINQLLTLEDIKVTNGGLLNLQGNSQLNFFDYPIDYTATLVISNPGECIIEVPAGVINDGTNDSEVSTQFVVTKKSLLTTQKKHTDKEKSRIISKLLKLEKDEDVIHIDSF